MFSQFHQKIKGGFNILKPPFLLEKIESIKIK